MSRFISGRNVFSFEEVAVIVGEARRFLNCPSRAFKGLVRRKEWVNRTICRRIRWWDRVICNRNGCWGRVSGSNNRSMDRVKVISIMVKGMKWRKGKVITCKSKGITRFIKRNIPGKKKFFSR